MFLFSNLAALRDFHIVCLVIVYNSLSWSVKGIADLGRLNLAQSSLDGARERRVVRCVRFVIYFHVGCTVTHSKKRCVGVSW